MISLRNAVINKRFHGWRIVGFSAFSQFVSMGFSIYILGIYMQPMASEFGVSPSKLGWGMSFFYLANSLVGPFVGYWIDRGKARLVMTLGATIFALGLILMGAVTNLFFAALVCVFLLAPGACMLGVLPCAALLVRWFRRRQSFAVGIAAIGISLGGFVMPPVANALMEAVGWRHSLMLLGTFIALVVIPLAWLLTVGSPKELDQNPDGDAAPVVTAQSSTAATDLNSGSLLKQKTFWLLTSSVGFLSLCSIMLVTYIVPFAVAKGFSSQQGALLISLYAGSAVLGKISIGWLGDRISKRKAMILVQLIATVGWLFMVLLHSMPALMASAVFVGFAVGGMTPIWAALIALHFDPSAFGRVKGIMTLVMLVFLIIPGPLGGYLYDLYGSYEAGFSLIWWVLPFGLLCAIFLSEKKS